MLLDTMDTSTTHNFLEVVDWIHMIYNLRLPHSIMSVSFGTCFISMWATTAILDTGSGYNNTPRAMPPLSWQRHAWADYDIPTVNDANENLPWILSAVIIHKQFGNSFYMTICFVADHFSGKVLISIRFTSPNVNSFCCANQQVEITKKNTASQKHPRLVYGNRFGTYGK